MSNSTAEPVPFQTIGPFQAVGIIGCGLIGCSIGAGLKKRGFPGRIVGCGRPGTNLNTALARGHVDAIESDPAAASRQCDLVVVCTPVDRIVEDVRAAARGARRGTILTDAGSVKQAVCDPLSSGLRSGVTFIGSHPIAGSEKQGCEHACPDRFNEHICVLTPYSNTPRAEVERLGAFWRSLGMFVVEMSAEAHDRSLAQTSHVPHVVAAAIAASLDDENRRLTGAGYLDTTRIASGDPALWTSILLANAEETAAGLRVIGKGLNDFIRAIEDRDRTALADLLRLAKQNRDAATKRDREPLE